MPNFMTIGRTVTEILRSFDFEDRKQQLSASLGFKKLKFQSVHVTVPNLMSIGQTVAKIWRYQFFLNMAAICHL